MNKQLFAYQEYARLKAKEAEVKEALSKLSEVILEEIGDEPRQANGYGLFSKVVRKSYQYSDRLKEREQEMKEVIKRAKEREERNGAEYTESTSLRYQQPR
jgi:hypothetical protein